MEKPLPGEGNGFPLFRNDDAQGVGPLGEADGRRVPETVIPDFFGVQGKGEVAAEFADPAVLDDGGPVMALRVGIEQAFQKGTAEPSIQRDPPFKWRSRWSLPRRTMRAP